MEKSQPNFFVIIRIDFYMKKWIYLINNKIKLTLIFAIIYIEHIFELFYKVKLNIELLNRNNDYKQKDNITKEYMIKSLIKVSLLII